MQAVPAEIATGRAIAATSNTQRIVRDVDMRASWVLKERHGY